MDQHKPLHTFDAAFDRLIGHEGGYVNNPRDPGGETKYCIAPLKSCTGVIVRGNDDE